MIENVENVVSDMCHGHAILLWQRNVMFLLQNSIIHILNTSPAQVQAHVRKFDEIGKEQIINKGTFYPHDE